MNRIKLQEKFTKLVGGLESDKSLLLDIFISKVFERLKSGQKIKINDLGYFHKIDLKVSSNKINNNFNNFSQIILFSDSENIDDYFTEDDIFWEPTKVESDFISNENLFSHSIGKDFLSNEMIQTNAVLIPVSRNEYFDLLDSKLEKLINSSEIVENTQAEVPCLNINIQSDEKDFSLEKSEKVKADQSEIDSTKIEIESNSETIDELPRIDFSEILTDNPIDSDLSNEVKIEQSDVSIEEERKVPSSDFSNADSISEISNQSEEVSIFDELADVPSVVDEEENEEDHAIDFIEKFDIPEFDKTEEKFSPANNYIEDEIVSSEEISWDKIISEISFDEEEISFEHIIESENIENKLLKENIEENNQLNDNIEETELIDFGESKEESFQETFDNVIQEIEKDEETESIVSLDEIDTESNYYQEEQENFDVEDANNLEEEEILNSEEEKTEEEVFESESGEELFDEKELEAVEDELTTKEFTPRISEEQKSEEYTPKKSNRLWILAIFIVIVISSAVVYFKFPEYFNLFKSTEQQTSFVISDKNAARIERNFEIPVTYPYPPIEEQRFNNSIEFQLNNETNAPEKSSDLPNEKIDDISNKEKTPVDEKVTAQDKDIEKVSDTIIKSGDTYTVQVASFRSETIAQNEVNKIKSKGYSAFQEKAEIRNRGTWYRVKVSGFKSVEEAKNFQLKYSKGDI